MPTVIVTGSTGEYGALTDEERKAAQKAVIDTAQGSGMTVIAGVSDMASLKSIELTKAAEQLGADGVMLTQPLGATNLPGRYQGIEALLGLRQGIAGDDRTARWQDAPPSDGMHARAARGAAAGLHGGRPLGGSGDGRCRLKALRERT